MAVFWSVSIIHGAELERAAMVQITRANKDASSVSDKQKNHKIIIETKSIG